MVSTSWPERMDEVVASIEARTAPLVIHNDAGIVLALGLFPSTDQFLSNNNANIHKINLTDFVSVRFLARVTLASSSGNTPRLVLRYHTSFSTTVGDYSDIGTSAVDCDLDATGISDSGFINLVSGAQADVFVTCVQTGGDGVNAASLGYVEAHFR